MADRQGMAVPENHIRTRAGSPLMGTPPWSRVKEVIEAALDRAPDERAQVVREMCDGDLTLQVEVESLLSAMQLAVSFVERPALESLASLDAVAPVQILDAAGRALQTGETIGPYEIVDFIGAGGMGEVYRARDRTLNRDSALKVLPK